MTREEFDRRYRARLVERGYCDDKQAAEYPTPEDDQIDEFTTPEDAADDEIYYAAMDAE